MIDANAGDQRRPLWSRSARPGRQAPSLTTRQLCLQRRDPGRLFHHLLKVSDALHAMQQADHQRLHRHRRALPVAVRDRNLRWLVQGVCTGKDGRNNQGKHYKPNSVSSSSQRRADTFTRVCAFQLKMGLDPVQSAAARGPGDVYRVALDAQEVVFGRHHRKKGVTRFAMIS